MKRITRLLMISMLVTVFISSTILGMSYNSSRYTSVNEVPALLSSSVRQGRATESMKTRGEFLMSVDLVVKDNGNGTTGAPAIAFTSILVDEACVPIYLNQWDEETEGWRQVDHYGTEFYSRNCPEGLEASATDIPFINQPREYYYRLRGMFGIVYNGTFETFGLTAGGVLLD